MKSDQEIFWVYGDKKPIQTQREPFSDIVNTPKRVQINDLLNKYNNTSFTPNAKSQESNNYEYVSQIPQTPNQYRKHKINCSTSRKIYQKHSPIKTARSGNYQNDSGNEIWDKLYKHGTVKLREKDRMAKMEKQLDTECTFTPRFISNSDRYFNSDGSTFIERNQMWSEAKHNKIIKQRQNSIWNSLQECTFKPIINKQNAKNEDNQNEIDIQFLPEYLLIKNENTNNIENNIYQMGYNYATKYSKKNQQSSQNNVKKINPFLQNQKGGVLQNFHIRDKNRYFQEIKKLHEQLYALNFDN